MQVGLCLHSFAQDIRYFPLAQVLKNPVAETSRDIAHHQKEQILRNITRKPRFAVKNKCKCIAPAKIYIQD